MAGESVQKWRSNKFYPVERMARKAADEAEKRRHELYDAYRKDVVASISSSSDDFDKSVLTYASAGLGLSIAFVKDIVPLKSAILPQLLYASWIAFCVAIVFTTVSFLVSMKAHMRSLEHAGKYYLDDLPEYLDKPNPFDAFNTVLVRVAGAAFILAVVLTVIFATINLGQPLNQNPSTITLTVGK